MNDEKQFDQFAFDAITALGHLMSTKEVCKNQKAVMKINRFRAWLMDLKPDTKPESVQENNNQ